MAVYLALDERLVKMEDLNLRVTDDGFTVIDSAARKIAVATEWKNLEGFKALLVDRLIRQ